MTEDLLQEETLALLDPLRDGRAAFRIGAFISGYLDAAQAGQEKSECLKKAMTEFSAQT